MSSAIVCLHYEGPMLRSRSFLLPALEEVREEAEEEAREEGREGGWDERREKGRLPVLEAPFWLARELALLRGDIPGGGRKRCGI